MGLKVVVIDYQLGNLFSVKQAINLLGHDALISNNPKDLLNADFAILPGVGAFSDAMNNLVSFGLDIAIKEFVRSGKHFMGICLGQQLMLTRSEEFGNTKGIGLIDGSVKKIPFQNINGIKYKVPQIQWNKIMQPFPDFWSETPLSGCNNGDYFYFVHSYFTDVENKKNVLATTKYGDFEYCSAIKYDNIFTTQFHPEKSGEIGLKIFKNWLSQK